MIEPIPHLERWQPLRLGLVDLYHYDTEEFWFHDGRLLLRGNNGAGKSKVLALSLPFLLDGDTSAYRVEPDGDRGKHMEWNLLLGGAHEHPERTGYTWLEFGRVGDRGPEFFTAGCGMKAVRGRSGVTSWFFTTSQRVGEDLFLLDPTRTALAKNRLVEAVGAHGSVHETAKQYRRQLDATLFRLGEDRYAALVDLLIQLRRPQLTQKPDEALLSAALTQALPPLDNSVLIDVADAFRALEDDRRDLEGIVEARDAADRFLEHYDRYARTAARRRAEAPRLAQSAYEDVRRQLTAAHAASERAGEQVGRLTDRKKQLEDELGRLEAREKALENSDEARDAGRLQEIADTAERARVAAQGAGRRLEQARDRHRRAQRELDTARVAQARASERAAADERAVQVSALEVGLEPVVIGAPADTRRRAVEAADRRRGQLRHVRSLVREVDALALQVRDAQAQVDRTEASVSQSQARLEQAHRAVDSQATEHVTALRTHLTSTRELLLTDVGDVLAATEVWAETLDGESPARTAADRAVAERTGSLVSTRQELTSERATLEGRLADLRGERERLQAGEDAVPPAARHRVHRERDGAPLWRLVDFRADVSAPQRAGLEAALEASGLLDGWIAPDGTVTVEDGDVVLRPRSSPVDRSLAELLVPAVDRTDPRSATVPDTTIAAVLASIGAAEGEFYAAADGSYRLGSLEGRWSKLAAEFVGQGAREAARRARLVVVEAEITDVRRQVEPVEEQLAQIERRLQRLTTERAELPTDHALRSAHATLATLTEQAAHLMARLEAERRRAAEFRATHQVRRDAALEDATQLGLPLDASELDSLAEALHRFELAVSALVPALHDLARTSTDTADAEAAASQLAAEEADAQGESTSAHAEAVASRERFDTLEASVGAGVRELQQKLAQVVADRTSTKAEHQRTDLLHTSAVKAQGHAEGEIVRLEVELEQETERRAGAAQSLYRFALTGVLAVALPELQVPDTSTAWAPDPTVRLARQIEQLLEGTSLEDTVWRRVQQRVTEELKPLADTLSRYGNSAELDVADGVLRVAVRFAGRGRTVSELREELMADATERQRLLDAREREVLENHLVAEVAGALQELIVTADRQVSDMNAELERRPTSTGMKLRMQWRVVEDGPAGLQQARERLLRQDADAWSATDRAAVGEFLKNQIDAVRADREGVGTWLEHLTSALDYRRWHRFVVQRFQNGQWRPASGPASGGERVLAASVPLFAAASSHYRSAGNPHAPRIITLDEAFAGVDDRARADYLGLLAEFDLDVVMTSEREWACYPQVPGIGISNLSRQEGIDAVLVTSYRWDGRDRERIARPATQEVRAAPREAAPDQDELF